MMQAAKFFLPLVFCIGDQVAPTRDKDPRQYDEVLAHCKKEGWIPDSEPITRAALAAKGFVEKGLLVKLNKGQIRFGWERVLSEKLIDPKINHKFTYNLSYAESESILLVIDDNKNHEYNVYASPVRAIPEETKNVLSFSRNKGVIEIAVVFQKYVEINEDKECARKWYTADLAVVYFDKTKE